MAARAGLLAVLSGSLVLAIALTRADPPPTSASFFGAFALASYASVIVAFAIVRGLSGRLITLTLLSTVGAVAIALFPADSISTVRIVRAIAVGLGIAGVIAYLIASASGSPDERARARLSFGEALILPLSVVQVTFYLWLSIYRNPIYDASILAFERRAHLVIEPAIVAAYDWSILSAAATACYLVLPVALAAIAARQRDPAGRLQVLLAALICGVIGFLLYRICPSTGPRDSLGLTDISRLAILPAIEPGPLWTPGEVPRNAMPSLHAAWALLLVLNAHVLSSKWRGTASAFALLNILAAVGRYQHWAMDVIVALPLGAAVQLAVVWNERARAYAFSAVCLGITIGWLVAIRTGVAATWPPLAAWAGLAITIALPIELLRRSVRERPV